MRVNTQKIVNHIADIGFCDDLGKGVGVVRYRAPSDHNI